MKDAAELGIPVHFFCGSIRSAEHPDTELGYHIAPQMIHFSKAGDDYMSATYKQWYGLRYLYTVYTDYDFFLIAGTDNYIECSKLLEELRGLDPTKPLYIGGHTGSQDIGYKLAFHFGGGGIILSKAALKELDIVNNVVSYIEEWAAKCKTLPNGSVLLPACDVALAFFAERVNLGFISKTGMYACNWMGKLEGCHCCHLNYPELITCHFMDENMYTYHSLKEKLKKEWYRNRIVIYYTLAKGVTTCLAPHIPTLYQLTADCTSVLQIRKNANFSCIPFIRALYENTENRRHEGILYTVDEKKPVNSPMPAPFPEAKICDPIMEMPALAKGLGVSYVVVYGDVNVVPTLVPSGTFDILFIETDDVASITGKLEKYAASTQRYIIVHSIGKNNHAIAKEMTSDYDSTNFVVSDSSVEDLTILKRVESTNTVAP